MADMDTGISGEVVDTSTDDGSNWFDDTYDEAAIDPETEQISSENYEGEGDPGNSADSSDVGGTADNGLDWGQIGQSPLWDTGTQLLSAIATSQPVGTTMQTPAGTTTGTTASTKTGTTSALSPTVLVVLACVVGYLLLVK
jgi:hypothetical protein